MIRTSCRHDDDVVIVGGGLAGLCCALRLHEAGVRATVLEACDTVGGRVRTDELDGFLLDRGFQVLLTAYPEARRVLDYAALELRAFYPGALVRRRGRFHRVGDPWRRPTDTLATLRADVGCLGDKLRIAGLRAEVSRGPLESVFARPETTALERLRAFGFTEDMIDAFFRPFFGGILLDRTLSGSSRMLDFVFRMMAEGDTALPARGMEAIPRQLAARLPAGAVRTNARVVRIEGRVVSLAGAEPRRARAVVVATEGPEAAHLTSRLPAPPWRAVTSVYFAAEKAPIDEPIPLLDGEGRGPVNNVVIPSVAARGYAPAGAALVSATVLGDPRIGDDALTAAVREQLTGWFGAAVRGWRHLRTYRIRHAQPDQRPPALADPHRQVHLGEGLYVCGDHRDTASIQGAMESGRRAAEAVLHDLHLAA